MCGTFSSLGMALASAVTHPSRICILPVQEMEARGMASPYAASTTARLQPLLPNPGGRRQSVPPLPQPYRLGGGRRECTPCA